MDVTGLRIALFTGNYNYVRDGANQALNRLVEYLLRQGAAVRDVFADRGRAGFPAERRRRPLPCRADPGPVRISSSR